MQPVQALMTISGVNAVRVPVPAVGEPAVRLAAVVGHPLLGMATARTVLPELRDRLIGVAGHPLSVQILDVVAHSVLAGAPDVATATVGWSARALAGLWLAHPGITEAVVVAVNNSVDLDPVGPSIPLSVPDHAVALTVVSLIRALLPCAWPNTAVVVLHVPASAMVPVEVEVVEERVPIFPPASHVVPVQILVAHVPGVVATSLGLVTSEDPDSSTPALTTHRARVANRSHSSFISRGAGRAVGAGRSPPSKHTPLPNRADIARGSGCAHVPLLTLGPDVSSGTTETLLARMPLGALDSNCSCGPARALTSGRASVALRTLLAPWPPGAWPAAVLQGDRIHNHAELLVKLDFSLLQETLEGLGA
mmetsp:Transcript_13615/g.21264  ORF Transcript_13615/g.21264 Transcript_13615/m.21264 type:complete len:365 (-) Transcript_13615:415-1509(-)